MMTMTGQTTNRDKLMAELTAMSNETLYLAFADNRLTRAIDDAMCADCKAEYGRCCSTDDDTPCPITRDKWMERPNTGTRILQRYNQRR